jgi:hypothetical protein
MTRFATATSNGHHDEPRVVPFADPADRLPPQNIEAEQGALGSILIDQTMAARIVPFLEFADFLRDVHQLIFEVIVSLYGRQKPPDVLAVAEELERRDWFKKIGGDDYLKEIIDSVPHAANGFYYAEIVKEKSRARASLAASIEHARDVYSNLYTADQLLDRWSQRLDELRASAPTGKLTICAADVSEEDVDYLWQDRLARGFVSLLAGETGLGKTFTILDVVARLTTGKPLPGTGEVHDPIRVLIISEDSQSKVLKPRLAKLGADLDRVEFMTWEAMGGYTLDNVAYLKRAWKDAGEPDLIVIDPPSNFTGRYNEHVNAEVRKMLTPITNWLAQVGTVCVALVTHVNKSNVEGLAALKRVMGSVAWTTTPRIVVGFVKDPKDPTRCICGGLKNNLGDKAPSLSYSIDKKTCPDRVQWHGESAMTADEAMSVNQKQTAGQKAALWVTERFREKRRWTSAELLPLGFAAGLAVNAILKSDEVKALPIRRHQVNSPDGEKTWFWDAMDGWPNPE